MDQNAGLRGGTSMLVSGMSDDRDDLIRPHTCPSQMTENGRVRITILMIGMIPMTPRAIGMIRIITNGNNNAKHDKNGMLQMWLNKTTDHHVPHRLMDGIRSYRRSVTLSPVLTCP